MELLYRLLKTENITECRKRRIDVSVLECIENDENNSCDGFDLRRERKKHKDCVYYLSVNDYSS